MRVVEDAYEAAPDTVANDSDVGRDARNLGERRAADAHRVQRSDHGFIGRTEPSRLDRDGWTVHCTSDGTVVDGIFRTGVDDQMARYLRTMSSPNPHGNTRLTATFELESDGVAKTRIAKPNRIIKRDFVRGEIHAHDVAMEELVAKYAGDGMVAGAGR